MLINYNIISSVIVLIINFIIKYLGNYTLYEQFWLSNPIGGICAYIISILFNNIIPKNIIPKNIISNKIIKLFLKYTNILIFQNVFYILLYNDYSFIAPFYFIKGLLYIFLNIIFNIIEYPTKNKYKKHFNNLLKTIIILIIIELINKNKLDNTDLSIISKIIFAFIFYIFLIKTKIIKSI